MKQVCITGKNSYVGRNVANWLAPTMHVDSISVRDEQWKSKDFSKYDVIFHVAGLAHSTPDESQRDLYYQVNTNLVYDIALKAKQEGVHQFIFMSSVIVYSQRVTHIQKDTPVEPDNFYGDSKKQAELKLQTLDDDSFKVVIIRSPMIYGPGSKGNYRRLSSLAKKTPLFPSFQNKRSMLFIDNLCAFVQEAIVHEVQGLFFPQNKEYVSTVELVKEVAHTSGHSVHFTSLLNPLIRLCLKQTMVHKLFGDFTIDPSLSTYSFSYQVCDFSTSISKTER